MDPIVATVIWGVLWFLSIGVVSTLIFWGVTLLGVITSGEREWPMVVGVIVGALAAIFWWVFSVVQVILHIVTLIQLLT